MANGDFERLRYERQRKRRKFDGFWNSLTLLMAFGIVAAAGLTVMIYTNPQTPFNLYPPPTMPARMILPTWTPTTAQMPPTWTPTVTEAAFPTPALPFTETPLAASATESPTPLMSDLTATATEPAYTPDPAAVFPFIAKGDPAPVASTLFHPEAGCNWQGVAGQVFDLQGRPVIGLVVRLTGTYNGKQIEYTMLTGTAQALYGDSGYEFNLGSQPVSAEMNLTVQLTDQSFQPMSEKITFSTSADCTRNLVLVNFHQVR